jgi:hypothetical protein
VFVTYVILLKVPTFFQIYLRNSFLIVTFNPSQSLFLSARNFFFVVKIAVIIRHALSYSKLLKLEDRYDSEVVLPLPTKKTVII